MNQDNNTVVSGEMLKWLRENGVADGYKEVPDAFAAKMKEILKDDDIADIDNRRMVSRLVRERS